MAVIVHIINGLESGGAEASMFSLCAEDRNNEHVVISLLGKGFYYSQLADLGISVYCLDIKGARGLIAKLCYLYELLKQLKPDVVQTWLYHSDLIGGLIARLAGIKNVCWGVHNTVLEPSLSKRSTIYVSYLCSVLSYFVPRWIICCAEKSLVVHAAKKYNKKKMLVVNNGYDLTRFYNDPELGNSFLHGIGEVTSHLRLGCVGRFDPNKDHTNLLDALAILKSRGLVFRCFLVGQQMTKDNLILNRWVEERELQDSVVLLGVRRDIPAVMNALDVHVLPSVAEAFPNVLCEAMACGTPCVTTDVGDAALIVGEAGWVVSPSNPLKLADAIEMASNELSDSHKWVERKVLCREQVEAKFSLKKMIFSYHKVWSLNDEKF